jgi:hypothetical protein
MSLNKPPAKVLLRQKISYNSQIKRFEMHVGIDFFLVLVYGTRAQSLSTPFSYTLYAETNEKENTCLQESDMP